jgi:hypothetical protein
MAMPLPELKKSKDFHSKHGIKTADTGQVNFWIIQPQMEVEMP